MVGAFVGPWAWGVARDATGGWRAGLFAIAVAYAAAVALIAILRWTSGTPAAAPAQQAASQ